MSTELSVAVNTAPLWQLPPSLQPRKKIFHGEAHLCSPLTPPRVSQVLVSPHPQKLSVLEELCCCFVWWCVPQLTCLGCLAALPLCCHLAAASMALCHLHLGMDLTTGAMCQQWSDG